MKARACELGVTLALMLAVVGGDPAHAQTPRDRGAYLVDAVMACDGCHTPRAQGDDLDLSRRFAGGPQTWDTPAYTVKGSNISSDRDTGIGSWTAAALKEALVNGVRPNGVPLAPQMTYAFYKVLTPGDLDAVVAYVRTVKPVRHDVQAPVYKGPMQPELVPGGERPMDEADMRDPLKRGFYLVTIAHCMECHARRPDGKQDFAGWLGGGGHKMGGPGGSVIVSNITSHPTKGIGAWSDADIKRALTQDIARDGRKLRPPMARSVYYSKMTDSDLNAIVAYLRTLPPLE